MIATERCLARLSEARRRFPDALKATEPDIDRRGIAALGNPHRHDNDELDPDALRRIRTEDLPVLKLAVERIKSRL